MSMPAATGLGRGEGSLDAGGRRGVNRGLRRVGDGVAEKRSCVTGDGVVERATGDERGREGGRVQLTGRPRI